MIKMKGFGSLLLCIMISAGVVQAQNNPSAVVLAAFSRKG